MCFFLGVVEFKKIGELKNIFVDKVEIIELFLVYMIFEVIGNLFLLVVIFLYIMFIDWCMVSVLLVMILILIFVFKKVMFGFNEIYVE